MTKQNADNAAQANNLSSEARKAADSGSEAIAFQNIVINGEETTVSDKEMAFDEIIRLAFPDGPFGPNIRYTVTYSDKQGRDYSLVEGQSVRVKKGMIFNVGNTDRS